MQLHPPPDNVNVSEGYELTGWDKNFNNIRSNLEINAIIEIKKFTVRFFDGSKLISTQTVEYNRSATAPLESQLDDRDNMEFVGWDKSYTNVKSNLDVYSVWQVPHAEPLKFKQMIYPSVDEMFKDNIVYPDGTGFPLESKPIRHTDLTHCMREVSGKTYIQSSYALDGRYLNKLHVECGNKTFDEIKKEVGEKKFRQDVAKYYRVSIDNPDWHIETGRAGLIFGIHPPSTKYGNDSIATLTVTWKDQTISIKLIHRPPDALVAWHCPRPARSPIYVRNYTHDFINHSCKRDYRWDVSLKIRFVHYTNIPVDENGDEIHIGGMHVNAIKCKLVDMDAVQSFYYPNLIHDIKFNNIPYNDIDNGDGTKIKMEPDGSFYLLKEGKWHSNGTSTLTFEMAEPGSEFYAKYSFIAKTK